jgi:gamma-glutamyl hercynylcysteine S-oxide hydrolase
MCRFVAYLGSPITIGSLIVDPANGLLQQAAKPRHQTFGTGNPDGWGVAWSSEDGLSRHRIAAPIGTDPALESLINETSGSILAAVRLATPGMEVALENTPPYLSRGWRFAHNGAVANWSDGGRTHVASLVSDARRDDVLGTTDSEWLFAALLTAIDNGQDPSDALTGVVKSVSENSGGALNLVLQDDDRIVASASGNSLFHRTIDNGVLVASEPFDDHQDWARIPDGSVVQASLEGITVTPLHNGAALK